MRGNSFESGKGRIHAMVLVVACILLPGLRQGWTFESSGLELKLYADELHADFKYSMDEEPVRLHLTIRNVDGRPIVTSRGYSQVELYNHIFVTDPAGVQHILGRGGEDHKMPPPFFINGQPWALAESLPSAWVRTVTFADLRNLLPMMRLVPGWYTIEARQSFIRFARSGQDPGLGLLGLLEHDENWHGTIKSKPLQIQVVPPAGAKLDVRVTSASGQPPAQVPVKVFRADDLPAAEDPAQFWSKILPVAAGATDLYGRVIWDGGEICLPKNDYEAVAALNGGYLRIPVEGDDPGWQEGGCQGLVSVLVEAGSPAGIPIDSFSLFALNSMRLEKEVEVAGGRVGVQQISGGPWLCDDLTELCLEGEVRAGKSQLYADTIFIDREAMVLDAYYNGIAGRGVVLGERITPLELPLSRLPVFLASEAGGDDVIVRKKKTEKLDPGSFGAVLVGKESVLELTGGTYHFESLTLEKQSAMICRSPCVIRVKGRIAWSDEVSVGPAAGAGISAGDIVFYVGGQNGADGHLESTPKAVAIGRESRISANIYVPGGTLLTMAECFLEGAFIGKDIQIGRESSVSLVSAF